MNINISSASEVSKPTLPVADSGNKDGEVAESEGFFSKLASMLSGKDSKGDAQAKSAATPESGDKGAKQIKAEGSEDGAELSQVKQHTTDSLLDSDETDSQAKLSEPGESKALSASSEEGSSQTEPAGKAVNGSAEKIVSENERVLQQLNESNQALQPKKGKELPLDEQSIHAVGKGVAAQELADDVINQTHKHAKAVEVSTHLDPDSPKQNDTKSELPPSAQRFVQADTGSPQASGQQLAVDSSSNAERFVQPVQGEELTRADEQANSNGATTVDNVSHVTKGAGLAVATKSEVLSDGELVVDKQQLVASNVDSASVEKSLANLDEGGDAAQLVTKAAGVDTLAAAKSTESVAAGVGMVAATTQFVSDENLQSSDEESDTLTAEPEQTSVDAAVLTKTDKLPVEQTETVQIESQKVEGSSLDQTHTPIETNGEQLTTAQPTLAMNQPMPQEGLASSQAQSMGAIDGVPAQTEEVVSVAAQASSTTAIPWAVSEEMVVDEMALQNSTAKQPATPQQAAVSQSVQQAIAAQQIQHQSQQVANNLNAQQLAQAADANQVQLQQIQQASMAPNTAAIQEQALAKAALGAKAAAGIGKLSANSDRATGQANATASQGDASFAQQIAQATGQQGNNLNPIRAEQTAAQAPLQLNREMAGDQVAERVQMMMSKNLKNIDIRLDPPELGRMQIRMNMNGDAASVQFTVANQQARDVIEQSMPRLREMLAQQGVQLGDTSVQQQSQGQQQSRYAAGGDGQPGQGSSNQTGLGEENLEPDINLDLNVASKRDGISYYA